MTTHPTWSAVDNATGDLLDLLADDGTLSSEAQWTVFVDCLRICADINGIQFNVIDPNELRRRVRGEVKPPRIGAFTRRAVLEGLVEYTGRYVISTDTHGKNAGKPCREMRWIGATA